MEISIVVCFDFEGIHCWPECNIEDVKFLRYPHRHQFKVRAEKKVTHDDRDIEFILLKREMLAYIKNSFGDPAILGRMSCEALAQKLLEHFELSSCEVLEDGENGAICKI